MSAQTKHFTGKAVRHSTAGESFVSSFSLVVVGNYLGGGGQEVLIEEGVFVDTDLVMKKMSTERSHASIRHYCLPNGGFVVRE